jgi:hypothetical protein
MAKQKINSEKNQPDTHQEDLDARYGIHELDRVQVAGVKKTVDEVCTKLDLHSIDNAKTNDIINAKIDRLTEMIEPIIQSSKINAGIQERFALWARIIITIAGVISAILVIVKLIFMLEK